MLIFICLSLQISRHIKKFLRTLENISKKYECIISLLKNISFNKLSNNWHSSNSEKITLRDSVFSFIATSLFEKLNEANKRNNVNLLKDQLWNMPVYFENQSHTFAYGYYAFFLFSNIERFFLHTLFDDNLKDAFSCYFTPHAVGNIKCWKPERILFSNHELLNELPVFICLRTILNSTLNLTFFQNYSIIERNIGHEYFSLTWFVLFQWIWGNWLPNHRIMFLISASLLSMSCRNWYWIRT